VHCKICDFIIASQGDIFGIGLNSPNQETVYIFFITFYTFCASADTRKVTDVSVKWQCHFQNC